MPSSVLQREKAWPLQYVENDGNQSSVINNIEFNEHHFHIFHGYANNQSVHACVGNEDIKLNCQDRLDDESILNIKLEKSVYITGNKSPGGDDCRFKHFIAGGIAGCVATTATCPLDVIKTRQQSSGHAQGLLLVSKPYPSKVARIQPQMAPGGKIFTRPGRMQMTQVVSAETPYWNKFVGKRVKTSGSSSILQHYRYIMKVEGSKALYKGLGPTLVGVVPSRAIYFFAYSNAKNLFTKYFGLKKDSSALHLTSAASAGACCTTATSPLWVIKTKLQLHRSVQRSMTVRECCARIWQAGGFRGFYRGMTASYAGILETVIHFVIYERLKLLHMNDRALSNHKDNKTWKDYAILMAIAALSKTTAACVAYPHEVVRTRLREETKKRKYRGFFQTLSFVRKQEGIKALYRGLGTQIVRQVPNMAIVMGTYEYIIDASSRI